MIIDCHTHIFPAAVRDDRDRFIANDATFAELYGSARAHVATADELIESMDAASIDVSVALGFAWRDIDACRLHNDYLLESASGSHGRIVAFCTLPLAAGIDAIVEEAQRCIAGGARGFGELRPDNLDCDLDDPELAEALIEAVAGLPLLFHVSEPVGHAYPGKHGFALDAFYRFVLAHPEANLIGAHWGGGLPFYALMPEVHAALARTHFDTAGTSLLYAPDMYERAISVVGAEKIVFGSDFPLLSQSRSRRRIEEADLSLEARDLVLGGNAARLLGLE